MILEGGGALKLIDLGVVRVPGLEEFPPENVPGTAAYMAPEMAEGEPGNEATDIYALGVTLFRAFTGEYPYANADAMSPPRRTRPKPVHRAAPRSAGLDRGGARPRDRARPGAALSRRERVRGGDGGGAAARADRPPPAADSLRARAGARVAGHFGAAGAGARGVAVGASIGRGSLPLPRAGRGRGPRRRRGRVRGSCPWCASPLSEFAAAPHPPRDARHPLPASGERGDGSGRKRAGSWFPALGCASPRPSPRSRGRGDKDQTE